MWLLFPRFQHKFSIVWLPAVVVHMDCYDSEKLVCGDFRGCVVLLQMESSFFSRLRRRADHLDPPNISFDELGRGRAMGMHCELTAKSHFANVVKVSTWNVKYSTICFFNKKFPSTLNKFPQFKRLETQI